MKEILLLLGLIGFAVCATLDNNEPKKCSKSTPVPPSRARRADIGQYGGQKTQELVDKQNAATDGPKENKDKEAAGQGNKDKEAAGQGNKVATKEEKPRSKREDKKPAPFPTGGTPVGEPNKDSAVKAATKDDKSKQRSKRDDTKIANQAISGQASGHKSSQISQEPIGNYPGQGPNLQFPASVLGQDQLNGGQIPPLEDSQFFDQLPYKKVQHQSLSQIPVEAIVPQLPGLVPGGELPSQFTIPKKTQTHLSSDEQSKTRPKRQELKVSLPQAPKEPAPKLPPASKSNSNEEPSDPINPVGKRQKRQSFSAEFEAQEDSSKRQKSSSSSSSEQVEAGQQNGQANGNGQRVKRQEPKQEDPTDDQSSAQDNDASSNDSAQSRARRSANKNQDYNVQPDEEDTVETEDDNTDNWQSAILKDDANNGNGPDDELSPMDSDSNERAVFVNAHDGNFKEQTKEPGL